MHKYSKPQFYLIQGIGQMDVYELIAVKRDEILSLAERFGIKNIRENS